MITLLIILLSSLWALILTDYFMPWIQVREFFGMGKKRKLKSDIAIIDYFLYCVHMVLNCSMCLSFHLTWIAYLILYHSFWGIILGAITYFLTFVIKEKILTIKL